MSNDCATGQNISQTTKILSEKATFHQSKPNDLFFFLTIVYNDGSGVHIVLPTW